jgi:uncharacterized protein YqiB (DUF1249 family)
LGSQNSKTLTSNPGPRLSIRGNEDALVIGVCNAFIQSSARRVSGRMT